MCCVCLDVHPSVTLFGKFVIVSCYRMFCQLLCSQIGLRRPWLCFSSVSTMASFVCSLLVGMCLCVNFMSLPRIEKCCSICHWCRGYVKYIDGYFGQCVLFNVLRQNATIVKSSVQYKKLIVLHFHLHAG